MAKKVRGKRVRTWYEIRRDPHLKSPTARREEAANCIVLFNRFYSDTCGRCSATPTHLVQFRRGSYDLRCDRHLGVLAVVARIERGRIAP